MLIFTIEIGPFVISHLSNSKRYNKSFTLIGIRFNEQRFDKFASELKLKGYNSIIKSDMVN